MQQQDVQNLLQKYLAGNCTAQEEAMLETWYLTHSEEGLPELTLMQLAEIQNSNPPVIRPMRRIIPVWQRVAAAILLFVLTGTYFILHKPAPLPVAGQHISPDIKPGTSKAILTLANGEKVILKDAKIGQVAGSGNSPVSKIAEGQLVYGTAKDAGAANAFNTIETPKGGQYQVTLADGTKVWLNAASSLKYPVAFNGNERLVELTGEAYFEVVHNAGKPFRVKTAGQLVEDIGTHFNVNAYADEPGFKTTLLEGSVKVMQPSFGKWALLVPGEQAVSRGTQTVIKQANIENVIAWKNGKFKFNNENIKDLLRKVARWYDVDFIYQGDTAHQDFSGSISRFDNIAKILSFLESTNTVHFKIEGRRITVMP